MIGAIVLLGYGATRFAVELVKDNPYETPYPTMGAWLSLTRADLRAIKLVLET